MPASNKIDLARLALSSGEGRRIDLELDPGTLSYGGQSYATSHGDPGLVEVSRMSNGYAFRLRFDADLRGPCMRCLADASIPVQVDAREVDQAGDDEELHSPYVDGEELRVGAWAHDALALALPAQLLCRPDCAGLCPVCGESLNDAGPGAHDHERAPDPRWSKLRELKLD